MKFSCTQENLNHALVAVSRIANRNANLPILQNVLIKAESGSITLSTTNLEIGIRATIRGKVEQPGDISVPAQLLANYVNLLPNDRIDCVLEQKQLHIKSGSQQTVIKGEDANDFPLLPERDDQNHYTVQRADFELGLRQTVIAASLDETRPEIAGVLCSFHDTNLILAATDSYRLAEKRLTIAQGGGDSQIILPQRAAQELLRILQNTSADQVAVALSDNQFSCVSADVEFISRVIEGAFPDYTQIIPQQTATTVAIALPDFIKAVKSAALFSKTGINDIQLTFSAQQHTITVQAINAQLGENSTTLPAPVQGEDVSMVFNYRYVLDALQQIQNQPNSEAVQIGISNSMSPGMFRANHDTNYTYIIMPIKQ